MYNRGSDGATEADLYQRLVEDDQVDFLFSGGPGSAHAMSEIASTKGIISMLSSREAQFRVENCSHLYAIHYQNSKMPTEKFIRDVRSAWGLTRIALVWLDEGVTEAPGHSGAPRAGAQLCKVLQEDMNAGRIEAEIVFTEQLADGRYIDTMARVQAAGADILIACTDNETEARAIVHAAHAA
eukprot:1647555-Rhodomonas_salina.1